MAVDKKIKYEDQPVIQGGVQNYLGKQPQVMAPRKWQSSPDKPATELAYITKAEKDLLLKKDLHNSLEGTPNKGPGELISLNGWGDASDGFGSNNNNSFSKFLYFGVLYLLPCQASLTDNGFICILI